MKTQTLYRPIGLLELELIFNTEFSKFPPRLDWQPIFYPVLNEAYAIEIATKWNLDDVGSGYLGFVTAFEVDTDFLKRYKVENAGGTIHNELWVPSEDMELFNNQIKGKIEVTKMYFGTKFQYPKNEGLKLFIKQNE
ncbi:MAG: ADP-ribosylation/crystallin J1 [Algibacter sp.]